MNDRAAEARTRGVRLHALNPGAARDPRRRRVFIASPYADAMTGETIYIDGDCHTLG